VDDFCEDVEEASNEMNFVQRTLFRLHTTTAVQLQYTIRPLHMNLSM